MIFVTIYHLSNYHGLKFSYLKHMLYIKKNKKSEKNSTDLKGSPGHNSKNLTFAIFIGYCRLPKAIKGNCNRQI